MANTDKQTIARLFLAFLQTHPSENLEHLNKITIEFGDNGDNSEGTETKCDVKFEYAPGKAPVLRFNQEQRLVKEGDSAIVILPEDKIFSPEDREKFDELFWSLIDTPRDKPPIAYRWMRSGITAMADFDGTAEKLYKVILQDQPYLLKGRWVVRTDVHKWIACAKLSQIPVVIPQEGVGTCSHCSGPGASELHTCPFAEEINGDYEPQCYCCADCEHECAMDI